MVDKNYCMSSYLAFRYVEKDDVEFAEGIRHKTAKIPEKKDCRLVSSAEDIEKLFSADFESLARQERLGILLSGGMDSACLASFMPKGSDAYTFRFENWDYAGDELRRAENFAGINGLSLHYVDIKWNDVESCLPKLMESKGAPVHSIEPQIYLAALQAKKDGCTKVVIGDAADYVFYGMDGLLAKDWTFDDFMERSIYLKPEDILVNPVDMRYLYERYRLPDNKIDFLGFYDKVVTEESYGSYENAFETAGISFIDPYESLRMSDPVDLERTRHGESKYYIRDLFRMRYPNIKLPEKFPMPRPVDFYFEEWGGVLRDEFKNIDVKKFSGNQKWQLFCLEYFLNRYDK